MTTVGRLLSDSPTYTCVMILEVAAGVIQRQSPGNSAVTETLSMRRRTGKMKGYWEFPGGKQESGESMCQCLIRELREELSIDVKVDADLGTHEFNSGDQLIKLHAFLVTRWRGEIALIDHDKMQWLTNDCIEQVKWSPADLPFVEQIKAGLSPRCN